MINKLLFVLLTVILSGLLINCGSDQKETDSKLQVKTQANQTKMETMYFDAPDPDGNIHSSTEWIGKDPVVINFWGTWCGPCRKEIPDLVRLNNEYKDKGVKILSLALKDSPQKVIAFSEKNNMDWIHLIADPAIAVKYNIRSVPTTIFIDRNGKIVEKYKGVRDYKTLKKGFDLIS